MIRKKHRTDFVDVVLIMKDAVEKKDEIEKWRDDIVEEE